MLPNRKGYFPFTYVETNINPDALIPIGPYYRNQVSVRGFSTWAPSRFHVRSIFGVPV